MAQATYPVPTWATRSLFKMIEPYLVLLRVEFTLQPTITSGPVRSYRTLSPLPIRRLAVFSLLHLSWARAPQPLTGTLPYGARTFLPLIIFVTGSDYLG